VTHDVKTIPPLFSLFACFLAAQVQGAERPAFALIPPQRANELLLMKTTPEARTACQSADDKMLREPHPLKTVHIEGTLPHHGLYDRSKEAKKDWTAIRDMALAYRLTGEDKYLKEANRFLLSWLDVYQLSFNPIDEGGLDALMVGYDLLKRNLPATTESKMQLFLRRIAHGYIQRIESQKKPDNGNWQSHRIKLITLSAFALGDAGLISKCRKVFQRHIELNIYPDGSVWDFYHRDALHYEA